MAEYVYVTEPVPEGYTEVRVLEILAVNNTHAYFMETAGNPEEEESGEEPFFTRLFLATLTGTGATDVLGKPEGRGQGGRGGLGQSPKPRGG